MNPAGRSINGGLAAAGAAALVIVCCAALPLVAAAAVTLAVGAWIGIGAALLVAATGIGLVVTRARRGRHCNAPLREAVQ